MLSATNQPIMYLYALILCVCSANVSYHYPSHTSKKSWEDPDQDPKGHIGPAQTAVSDSIRSRAMIQDDQVLCQEFYLKLEGKMEGKGE